MGRETFEDIIRDKFEGQTAKAPKSSWKSIKNSMNADLVDVYESRQSFYKWLSVAALFIAVLLLGVLLTTPFEFNSVKNESNASEINEGSFYNALLSNDLNYNDYYKVEFKDELSEELNFSIMSKTSEKEPTFDYQMQEYDLVELDGKRPHPSLAETQISVYEYYTLGAFFSKETKQSTKSKLWAGIEAGAGTFENSLSGSSLSSSLNPAGLANAIGSGNFVNPTTNISQDMEQALTQSIAIDLGVQLGKKWTIESGISYTNFDNNGIASISVLDVFTIDNSNFEGGNLISVDGDEVINPSTSSREATIEIERNYDHEVELNNSIQFASIPLKAGYFLVDKKFSLRLNAGLTANYLVQGSISDPTSQIVNSDNLGIYNDWSFDGIGGMELGYTIFDKFDFTVEPNYRYAITPLSNASNLASRFAIQTGLRYTLK